jgi:phosphate uptake regulator
VKALREVDTDLAREVIAMDDEVDRFSLYVIRQLKAAVEDEEIIKEIGLSTGRDCLGYRLMTKTVERTADHAVKIAENVSVLKSPLETELLERIESMSHSAISVFNEAIETLFEEDFRLADKTIQKAKRVASLRTDLMKTILKRTDIEGASSLSLIVESITRVAEYSSDIAEIVLNLNIRQVLP